MFHLKGDTIVAWRLLAQINYENIHGRERTSDNGSFLTLWNKLPLHVIVRFCANMLAISLPNGVSPSKNQRSHVKCLIFFSDINPIWTSRHNCNKISRYKISQKSTLWETSCFTQTGKLTGSYDDASSSFYLDSANTSRVNLMCIGPCIIVMVEE